MQQFLDHNGCVVQLTFEGEINEEVGHVWIVCRYNHHWLLTQHQKRGIEFPGGKVEPLESVETAARREVYEETGAEIDKLIYIGQYVVQDVEKHICKNVYFAKVNRVVKKNDYFETKGPILLDEFPHDLTNESRFSFIMKDRVLPLVLAEIKRRKLI